MGDASLGGLRQRVPRPHNRNHAHVALVNEDAGKRSRRRSRDELPRRLETRDALYVECKQKRQRTTARRCCGRRG